MAGALGLEVVIIAPGGLGVSFDQLALNKALLEKHGARLRGVILNKVEPAKYDMVKDYYARQLKVRDFLLLLSQPHPTWSYLMPVEISEQLMSGVLIPFASSSEKTPSASPHRILT